MVQCEQCSLYKVCIEEMQERINEADKRLLAMDKLKDEHDKETIYRKEMEEKWNEKLDEHKNKANSKILDLILVINNKYIRLVILMDYVGTRIEKFLRSIT